MGMWIIGGAVIISIVILPKILVGSQRQDYKDVASGDDDKQS